MPAHPVALALIEKTGPLAAPSANISGHSSPVTAEHVRADLDGRIAAILDAGSTGIGVESTIIDLSEGYSRILRRGGLPVEEIEELLGRKVDVYDSCDEEASDYHSNTLVLICRSYEEFNAKLVQHLANNKKVAVVYYNNNYRYDNVNKAYELNLKGESISLYSILRDAEENNIDVLLFEPLPGDLTGITLSLLDRLNMVISVENER